MAPAGARGSYSGSIPEKIGVQVYPYVGDWLVKGRSRAQVVSSTQVTQLTFRTLGLVINVDRSTFCPVQRIEFIRAVLDSIQARAFLPEV